MLEYRMNVPNDSKLENDLLVAVGNKIETNLMNCSVSVKLSLQTVFEKLEYISKICKNVQFLSFNYLGILTCPV